MTCEKLLGSREVGIWGGCLAIFALYERLCGGDEEYLHGPERNQQEGIDEKLSSSLSFATGQIFRSEWKSGSYMVIDGETLRR